MDAGVTASAENVAEPEINAVVTPDRRVLELKGVVNAETVTPVIEELRNAKPAERLLIYIRANGGGEIRQLVLLIQALGTTQADVELAIGRYAMSAAATLWLWFLLDPIQGDDGVGRVVSVDPLKPTVLLFHRPRWPHGEGGEYYCFIEDFEDETVRENLSAQVEIFDNLFERILALQGFGQVHAATVKHEGAIYKHHLHFAREAYYGNNDYVISLNGVAA
ncbi:hypothetical protein PKB_5006 [Pseudomonas knackmussii B13]|uniref:Uncharacterized protein n=1 Tax=Pseudomonas knackmussii (strain DSM 6978 / CCUG 54928 / LMG 23759 / B13) TaxID=1301098 RepID=A0A024HNT3_PSEKB|nr:hypothetical protein [Pseudomonas knackmussii]CDF86319.1 hypothetical protein PKB_5006 [Pseudomonas knackmussii B13]